MRQDRKLQSGPDTAIMRPMSQSLEQFARDKLALIDEAALRRQLRPCARGPEGRGEQEGRRMKTFCDNDYLGLSQHPALIEAAAEAARRWGAGAGASRLVTGDCPLYHRLESRLARLKGSEAALVFGSGYLANIGIVPVLAGKGDLILADSLIHACLHAGARLSGARIVLFRHNDAEDCETRLSRLRPRYRHCLIVTEGVFSMDGDRAPVAALAALAAAHDAWLLVDDAHALGVIGQGRGSGFPDTPAMATDQATDGAAPDAGSDAGSGIDLRMGTLSKAVGAYGGYLAASRAVIDLMINRARSLIYTTGLPPPVLAAAETGVRMIEEEAALVARPLALARRFTDLMNLPRAESAIVPLILGEAGAALEASARLAERGFLVTAIRPPTVPEGTARLRLTFSAAHAEADIEALAGAIGALDLKIGCETKA